MFEIEKLARDLVNINGEYFLVDTCKAPDIHKWETGIAKINAEEILQNEEPCETEEERMQILRECADDYVWFWQVETHPNKEVARERHAEICKTGKLKEIEW